MHGARLYRTVELSSVVRVAMADGPQASQWHAFRIIKHTAQLKKLFE
jgi:hypothetical protein